MTTYRRRNFPHPTLKPSGGDYDPSIFFRPEIKGKIKRSDQPPEFTIEMEYQTNSEVLKELIAAAKPTTIP